MYGKCPHIFCTDVHEVLLFPVVNAVNFLILGAMLFILDHAPFMMACLMLVMCLVFTSYRMFLLCKTAFTLQYQIRVPLRCIPVFLASSRIVNRRKMVCPFGRVYSNVQLL